MNEKSITIASHLNEIYYGKGYDPIWDGIYDGVRKLIIKGVLDQVTRSVLTSHQGIIEDIEQKRP